MEKTDKSQIIDLVIRSVKEIGTEEKNRHLINAKPGTELFGKKGNLDSLTLLKLIVNIEDKISTETGKNILIADEQTMSYESSPFHTVDTLVKHIEQRLKDNE
ncbi:MAG: hypothetical protein ACLQQ4_14990 [Bacteroidia bacterium]